MTKAARKTPERRSPTRARGETAALDAEIARLVRAAFVASGIFAALMVATLGWVAFAAGLGVSPDVVRPVGSGLAAVSIVCMVVTLHLSGRPIQRRTRYDRAMTFFVVWFFAIFGLAMPTLGIGSVVCLAVGIRRFGGTIGETAITFGERAVGETRFYPKVTLEQRETYPLGVAYVTLAILWPAIVFFLCRGWFLPI